MIIQKNLIITTFICLLLFLAIYLRFLRKKKQVLKTSMTRNNALSSRKDITNQLVASNSSGNLSTIPNIIMTGAIAPFAVKNPNIPPDGWLICDGKSYKRETYSELSKILGGDDTLSFNTPDLKNRFIRGTAINGRALGHIQLDSFKSHSHIITSSPHSHGEINSQPLFGGEGRYHGNVWDQDYTEASTTSTTSNITIQGTYKGSTPGVKDFETETRPVNICLLYCIKT